MTGLTFWNRDRSGFTLIELMIVVVVISILVAISIPLFLRNRMAANEASAISAMRTLSTSQSVFRQQVIRDDNDDGIGDYGTLTELATPPGGGTHAFIDQALGSGVKGGYEFTVVVFPGDGNSEPAFSAYAIPGVYAKTGDRNFYVDQEGVLRFNLGPGGQGTIGPTSPPVN